MNNSSDLIRIVSFNAHKGKSTVGRKVPLHEMAHLLHQEKTNIALMQEIAGGNRAGVDPFKELQSSSLKEHLYGANVVKGGHHHGNAIFTQGGTSLELIGNFDISAHRLERRGLLMARATIKGRSGVLISAHLALTHQARLRQVNMIQEHLSQLPKDDWVIMGGDFNCWGAAVKNQLEETGLTCADLGGGKTFPSVLPLAQLDKIFVKNCNVVNSGVFKKAEWARFSDHLPIWADVDLA